MIRQTLTWRCGLRSLHLGERSVVMGILNVTPDSFSDGGRYIDFEQAVARGVEMSQQGAQIIDVGGESTRPGAASVSIQEELDRVLPVVQKLAGETECLLSIDTTKSAVARAAVDAGVSIINDVSALTMDAEMMAVVSETGAGVVLMHMLGVPRTMQKEPTYGDVVAEVIRYLEARVEACVAHGIPRECIAVDPGIGFGKTVDHNMQLLAQLDTLASLRCPVLVGISRKSFLGHVTGRPVEDRLAATLGATAYALGRGAHIIRVHDVKESCDTACIADMLMTWETRNVGIQSNSSSQP